jgi:hypothetical protein
MMSPFIRRDALGIKADPSWIAADRAHHVQVIVGFSLVNIHPSEEDEHLMDWIVGPRCIPTWSRDIAGGIEFGPLTGL